MVYPWMHFTPIQNLLIPWYVVLDEVGVVAVHRADNSSDSTEASFVAFLSPSLLLSAPLP